MADFFLNGNMSGLLADVLDDEASDHEDTDLRRSMVDGADDESKKSNASKPTLNCLHASKNKQKNNNTTKKGCFLFVLLYVLLPTNRVSGAHARYEHLGQFS